MDVIKGVLIALVDGELHSTVITYRPSKLEEEEEEEEEERITDDPLGPG